MSTSYLLTNILASDIIARSVPPYDKLQLDLIYIQNYSIFLDIKLILMTIKIMFMKESTEGFSEEQKKEYVDR